MAKKKTKFVCQECGYETPKWMGRCPGCHEWNTMVEELNSESLTIPGTGMHRKSKREKAIPITQVEKLDQPRSDTGIRELNRVLGGGLVPGSFVLVGGDPGIGTSTASSAVICRNTPLLAPPL